MEMETLFTEQKWNILKALSKGKYSPLQLAQTSNTTIANISQQLRLLEMTKLVKKEKIPNREKGKPRSLFSLTNDYSYLILVMREFAGKRLLELDDYHRSILRIWFLEDSNIHYYVEKFYWKIEDYLDQIKAILINQEKEEIEAIIIAEKPKELEKKIGAVTIKKDDDESRIIKTRAFTIEEFKKLAKQGKEPFSSLGPNQAIYDPEGIIIEINKLGVVQKNES